MENLKKFLNYFSCSVLLLFPLHFLPCVCFVSFIFGDSLVDSGNNNYLFTLSKADSPPYGIDFNASGGQPTGRFTNGRTILDIIGQELGNKTFPPPYLAPRTMPDDAIHTGINYASGSSGILDETGILFIGRIPLSEQVNNFEVTRRYIAKRMGSNGAKEFLKDAIFSVTTGSNDVLNYLLPSLPFFKNNEVSPNTFRDYMISNLTTQLKRLHKLGARRFIVNSIGPIGCIPFVRAVNFLPTGSCLLKMNKFIEDYNDKLKKTLNSLNQETGPDTIFVYVNSYDIVLRIILNYGQYGFETASEPCCGESFPPFLCIKGDDANKTSLICDDRSKYVFWDAYHPTEAANVIISNELLDVGHGNSFPISIRELYSSV